MYNCMEFDANRRIIPILCDSYAICLDLCDYSILVGIMYIMYMMVLRKIAGECFLEGVVL